MINLPALDEALVSVTNTDILDFNNVQEILLDYFDNGFPQGDSTGVYWLDNNFRFVPKWLYMIYGMASVGKSSFLRFIMVSFAKSKGAKFAIYAFEENPINYINNLCKVYLEAPTMKKYNNRCSKGDYIRALQFVKEHFFFVAPNTDFSISNIEKCFGYLHNKKHLNGVVLDPINQVELPNNLNLAEKWSTFYFDRKKFVNTTNLFYLNVGHTIKQSLNNATREYDIPDAYSLDGGSMHFNKNDFFAAYHRPFFVNEPNNPICTLKIHKVKDHDTCGKPATIDMKFKYYQGVYLPDETNPDLPVQVPF